MRNFYLRIKAAGSRAFLAALLCLMSVCQISAQSSLKITGAVTGPDGQPLPGATVTVSDSAVGTVTDENGFYTISVPKTNSVLTFSFLGYKSQSVRVDNRPVVDVTLEEDLTGINEIVVLGYGSQRKKYVAGAVSQVGGKELAIAPMSNVSNMIAGRVTGVVSVQRSGMPGNDQSSFTIRGMSTFNDPSPLILVDGVQRTMNTVNPNDIENISILKDAATTAIYGVEGSGGVVLITTKKGTLGKTTISYDGAVTFTQNTAFPEFLNGPDYIYWYNKASVLDNKGPVYDSRVADRVTNGDPDGIYGNTDWFAKTFNKFGFEHRHNITLSGGNEKNRYYASIGVLDQDGIVKNVDYQRYNIRANVESNIAKNLMFTMSISGYHEDRMWPGIGLGNQVYLNPIQQAVLAAPIINDTYNGLPTAWTNSVGEFVNPEAALEKSGYQNRRTWSVESFAKLQYDFKSIRPLRGLKASVWASYDFGFTGDRGLLSDYRLSAFNRTTLQYEEKLSSGIKEGGGFTKSASYRHFLMFRPALEYDREFGKHSVSALLFYETQQTYNDTMTGYAEDFFFFDPIDITLGTRFPETPVSGSFSRSAKAALGASLTYIFDKKYIAEFRMRYDGTYLFAKDNRWGFFPSASLGWLISEEKFFKDNVRNVELFKLRGSYGMSSSLNTIDPFLYMRTFSTTGSPAYVVGDQGKVGIYTSNAVLSNLAWPRFYNTNVGFELSMWKGMLGIEFDWFYQLSTRLRENTSSQYPGSLGGNYSSVSSTGSTDNRGFEIAISHTNRINSDWRYSLKGTLSYSKNRILSKIYNDGTPANRRPIGQEQGYLYGFRVIGIYRTQEDIDNSPAAPSGFKRLGDLMYEDVNGDGRITSDGDFVRIGNPTTPKMTFSLLLNLSYKNLYMDALFQGSALTSYQLNGYYNSGVPDNTSFTRPFYGGGNTPYYLVEGSWTPENTDALYPRLSTEHNGNNAWPSDLWTKDGSYLRLKSIQIGYNFGQKALNRTGIEGLTVYVAGENVFTLTSFKYVDPEMPSITNGYYPQQRKFSVGLRLTF